MIEVSESGMICCIFYLQVILSAFVMNKIFFVARNVLMAPTSISVYDGYWLHKIETDGPFVTVCSYLCRAC